MNIKTIKHPMSVTNDITLASIVIAFKHGIKYYIPGMGWVLKRVK